MEGNNEGGRKFCGQDTKKHLPFLPSPTPPKNIDTLDFKNCDLLMAKALLKG